METVIELGLLGAARAGFYPEGRAEARGSVPPALELFQDHFPDFPVLPGVMILDILKKTADAHAKTVNGQEDRDLELLEIRRIKFSSFLRPGMDWECILERSAKDAEIIWKGRLMSEGERVAAAEFIYRKKS